MGGLILMIIAFLLGILVGAVIMLLCAISGRDKREGE